MHQNIGGRRFVPQQPRPFGQGRPKPCLHRLMIPDGRCQLGMRKPCGAWIWDDVKNMPALAPDSHDKLSKAQVSSAVAIWVNEKQELITLEKTSN